MTWRKSNAACCLISALEQNLDGCHFSALIRRRLGTLVFPPDFTCLSFCASMDSYRDHALLCRSDPSSVGYQLHYCLVHHPSLGWTFPYGGAFPPPPQARRQPLVRSLLFRGWLCLLTSSSTPDAVLTFWVCRPPEWLERRLYCVFIEQVKLYKCVSTCISHNFDFITFGFFHLRLLWPEGWGTPLLYLRAFQLACLGLGVGGSWLGVPPLCVVFHSNWWVAIRWI